jgi:DNA modification methylase
MFSFVGDTVLDPFIGSGTTMLSCCDYGRNSIGIDIDEDYLKNAYMRIKNNIDLLNNENVNICLELNE